MNPQNKRNVIGKQIDSMICINEPSCGKLTLKCVYCGDTYDTAKRNFVALLDGKTISSKKAHYYCRRKLCKGSNPFYHPKLPNNLVITDVLGGGNFYCKCKECGKINKYHKSSLESWDELCKDKDCSVAIRYKELIRKKNLNKNTKRSIPLGYKTDYLKVEKYIKASKGYKCRCNNCNTVFDLSIAEVRDKKPHCTNKNCKFYGRRGGVTVVEEVNGFKLIEILDKRRCTVECLSCHSKFERGLGHFKNSLIRCPSLSCQNSEKIGAIVKQSSGLEVEILDYENCNNVKVKFLIDGTEVTTNSYKVFNKKCLTHPDKEVMKRLRMSKYIGKEFSIKSGEIVKVIGGDTSANLVIQFNDGSTLSNVCHESLKKGCLDFRLYKKYNDKVYLTNPTLQEGNTYYDCTCKKCGFRGTFSKIFIDKHIEECYCEEE